MMIHTTLNHALAVALLSAILVACQPTPADNAAQITASPSATATQSAFVNPPINPTTITETPAPTRPTTSTPQPFITDGGALPEGARMRIGIGYINAAAPSPDGTMVAVGTSTGIYVYRLPGFERVWRRYTEYPIESVAWSPDGTRLLTESGQWGNPAILWDGLTGDRLNSVGYSGFALWSPDGSLIATTQLPRFRQDTLTEPGGITLFDGRTGNRIGSLLADMVPNAEDDIIQSIAWLAEGSKIAGETFETIYVWDINTREIEARLDPGLRLHDMLVSPDGGHLSSGYEDVDAGSVGVITYDTATWELAASLETEGYAWNVEWSPDAHYLAIEEESRITIVDSQNWQVSNYAPPVAQIIGDLLAWSPDSTRLALITISGVQVVEADSGASVTQFLADSFEDYYVTQQILWFPDGRSLMMTTGTSLTIWDTEAGTPTQGFSTNAEVPRMMWSDDGTTLVISSPEGLQYWNLVDMVQASPPPAEILALEPSPELHRVIRVPSPDDSLVATSTYDDLCGDGGFAGGCFYVNGRVTVHEAEGDRFLFEVAFAESGIFSLAWSLDGRLLAIGLGQDKGDTVGGPEGNEVIIVDVASGQEVTRYTGHAGNVMGLAWSPNGLWLASSSRDGTVIVWNISH